MREVVSSILKLGLINSGMFDTLELNTDVRAVHLVGDNNVGKTSLIELIQFLYFPDLREAHFSKSITETMAFYFRREGSYILFTVRTVRGTQRTLGIFGRGTTADRQVFAFDGAFAITQFLDDQQHVIPPERMAIELADRRFHLFTRPEDHERALVGEHSEDQANVHLFDLGRSNFRLLRRLLQNLLRLERLSTREIRQFLNALIESTGARTRIDVARDFDRKYAETRAIRDRINSLLRLKPLIDVWIAATERFEHATRGEQTARIRLSHAAKRYAAWLEDQRRELSAQTTAVGAALTQLDTERQQLANNIATKESRIRELQQTVQELQQLTERCAGRHLDDVQTERDQFTYQAVELQSRLNQMANLSATQIERRLRNAQDEFARIRRQIDSRALSHMLAEANFSDEQRALIRFLISEQLLSQPIADAVDNIEQLGAAVQAAAAQIDSAGVFRGFGLTIARSVWYRPVADEEPLADRLAVCEQRITDHERELVIARDRESVQQQIVQYQRQSQECDALMNAFQRLAELEAGTGGSAAINRELEQCRREHQEFAAHRQPLTERVREYQDQQVTIRTQLRELEQRLNDVRQIFTEVGVATEPCPDDFATIAADELASVFQLSRDRYRDQRNERRRAEEALQKPRAELDNLYEREAPDAQFEDWVEEKRRLTNEVERLEARLRESYTNLITLMKGELDKLTQAFEAVRSRVAELNNGIRRVSISNIERIELQVQESQLVEAIRQTSQIQFDMFTPLSGNLSLEEAEQHIEHYLVNTLRAHGRELNLDDLFHLEFRVTYAETGEQRTVSEIHAFESNGTAIGVKIVVYLGLIRLVQGNRRGTVTRIPFFLDEVGSLSSNNVRQLIAYCGEHNFLPIFASPTIRSDIPHSYILQRNGDRSRLINEVILTEREPSHEIPSVDQPTLP